VSDNPDESGTGEGHEKMMSQEYTSAVEAGAGYAQDVAEGVGVTARFHRRSYNVIEG
jgi:hypothetical protein